MALISFKGDASFKEFGSVIFASGGCGADFTQTSLWQRRVPICGTFRQQNGEHYTGDVFEMNEAIGANTIDPKWVEVHTTFLVKPDDPDAKIKFIATEAPHGVGSLVFVAYGNRFANELGRRNCVTGEM